MLRCFVLLTALLTTLLASNACQQQREATPSLQNDPSPRERVTGSSGGSLTYRVISPPKTFNYLLASDVDSLVVCFLLMGGRLVELDHDTQRYVSGLAEAWKLNDDRRTLEITLRDSLRFSDGHPLTAEDVLFTFRAIYNERTASPIFRDAMTIGGRQIEVVIVDTITFCASSFIVTIAVMRSPYCEPLPIIYLLFQFFI